MGSGAPGAAGGGGVGEGGGPPRVALREEPPQQRDPQQPRALSAVLSGAPVGRSCGGGTRRHGQTDTGTRGNTDMGTQTDSGTQKHG